MIGKKAKNKPSFIGIECIPQAIKVGWSMNNKYFFHFIYLTYWQHKQLNILLMIINGYQ